ncbi:12-oxophytodienoate reductase [Plectosphaerella plurivora]|uniref:12-oxophytodienoate reductase n=1 Tax=Plectosphaerella plurivora TaxID=936078 RepID=A0A9P8V373_9PEZI|nr:12-oxophytodienoate reductase [Plectosphaerella plurivora]
MTASGIADLVAKANARGPTSGFTDVSDADEAYPEGFDPSKAKILTPLKVGDLILQHRIVHAALGRSRCANHTETPLAVEYFRQRTTPGALMVSQATGTSIACMGWPWGLAVEGPKRLAAVAKVIDVVHEKGGYWFQQLTHVGRASSPGLIKNSRARAGLYDAPSYGYLPVSSSAVAESGINTHSGEAFGVPHALEVDEIRQLVADFKETAKAVASVGADGIEILAGNGFLLDQFLHDNVNQRTDEYGGSIENRSRFPLEIVDAVAEVVGYQRVGVRLSPFSK